MTGAKAIVTALEREGVTTVFGYPGAAICPVYDCLVDSPICHILVRQEQNAGHAAAAFGRIENRPGVCIATSGPGALNLITALATAYTCFRKRTSPARRNLLPNTAFWSRM